MSAFNSLWKKLTAILMIMAPDVQSKTSVKPIEIIKSKNAQGEGGG